MTDAAPSAEAWGLADLPWDAAVDSRAVSVALGELLRSVPGGFAVDEFASLTWGEDDWSQLGAALLQWGMSNLLHGERAAAVGARLVGNTARAADEARHGEAVDRFLTAHVGGIDPVDPGLDALYRSLVEDGRPEVVDLGFQLVIEGYGAALYGMLGPLAAQAGDPLLAAVAGKIDSDEDRHRAEVATVIADLQVASTAGERSERSEIAADLVAGLHASFLAPAVWERFGIAGGARTPGPPARQVLGQLLFTPVVAACTAAGLVLEPLERRLVALGLA